MNFKSKISVLKNDLLVHTSFVHNPVYKSDEFDIFIYLLERIDSAQVTSTKFF